MIIKIPLLAIQKSEDREKAILTYALKTLKDRDSQIKMARKNLQKENFTEQKTDEELEELQELSKEKIFFEQKYEDIFNELKKIFKNTEEQKIEECLIEFYGQKIKYKRSYIDFLIDSELLNNFSVKYYNENLNQCIAYGVLATMLDDLVVRQRKESYGEKDIKNDWYFLKTVLLTFGVNYSKCILRLKLIITQWEYFIREESCYFAPKEKQQEIKNNVIDLQKKCEYLRRLLNG